MHIAHRTRTADQTACCTAKTACFEKEGFRDAQISATTSSKPTRRNQFEDSRLRREPGGALSQRFVRFARRPF
jgi:hypothetical protein